MLKKLALAFFLSLIVFSASSDIALGAVKPFPKINLPCTKQNPEKADFHSLRPFQAAPCGEANKAYYCSNDLIFVESFDMAHEGQCQLRKQAGDFTCDPEYPVDAHNLYVSLDESDLPILGNTEDVRNSRSSDDTFDDAQKVNEYASWYLNGVNTRAEYGESKSGQVDFSGPIQKLLPGAIADAQRTKVIETALVNHNQIAVCAKGGFQPLRGWLGDLLGTPTFGVEKPVECYPSSNSNAQETVHKLADWQIESPLQNITSTINGYLIKIFPGNLVAQVVGSMGNRWTKRTPPLPWADKNNKPFATNLDYQKAYNEWRGQLCAFLPNLLGGEKTLVCLGAWPILSNPFADLYQYIPLAETPDKFGSENIKAVVFEPSAGAAISGEKIGKKIIPPLYFAHTEEVKKLSEILNQTYIPKDVQSVPLPETTEKNECSVVNVRANPGDNLFPGDEDELQLQQVSYRITQATCHETYEEICEEDKEPPHRRSCHWIDTLKCPTEITIRINTETITPNVNEIFSTTVADSTSTFRRIYPKVEEGAPVSCIADIPTVTNVTYDPSLHVKSQDPRGGSLSFSVENKPIDGGNTTPQLTFPHVGSVYEYFLKGIQTALRPKGYGEQVVSGICKPPESTTTGACKMWLFEKDSSGQFYYDKVIQAASTATCNGKSLNPFWAMGIALNENGGLMSDDSQGSSNTHFGCNIRQVQTIEEKIACMTNTLRNDCLAGKTDAQTLMEYGYPSGAILWPITVLAPGTSSQPLFGGGFDTAQLIANLLNTDWIATYGSKAPIFCPNSPILGKASVSQ